MQFLSRFPAFGKTVGEDDAGLHAFLAGFFNNGNDSLVIHRDHGEGNFARHVGDAWVGFQTEYFGTTRIDWNDPRRIKAHILQILENIDGVVIAIAGADDRQAIGFEERR